MRIKLLARRGFHSNSSIQHSISGIKTVFSRIEVDNFVLSSNTWLRGRSYAVSAASDLPDPDNYRKRVPIEARRAMVESFVDKYKASHAGKLPMLSLIWKQVGGSYYVVRKIFQELQNESTMSSLKNRSKSSFQKPATKENPNVGGKRLEEASDRKKFSYAEKILSADEDVEHAAHVSHSVLPLSSHILEDSEEVISASHKKPDGDNKDLDTSEHVHTESHVLYDKDLDTSEHVHTESHVLYDKDLDTSEHVHTESHVPYERDVVSDSHLESTSSCEDVKHEDPNIKEQQVHSSLELDRENINNRTMDVAGLPTSESKPWGQRIKSIVDGIFNMWRKL